MFAAASWSHMARPTYDEWDAYASLVATALQSLQFAISSKELGVGSALFVRSIVTREDDQSVLSESFLLKLGHQFTHVTVHAGYHGCKLCVCMLCGIISTTFVARIILVLLELFDVMLYYTVIGLYQFGMR